MILSSLFGGTLPDILDPPFSSRHRFLAHSKLLLCIFLVMWIASLFVLLTDPNSWIWTIYFFLLGYISHLLLDSLTPAGLH
ncbi:MAG: metal-dependent hydrolase [Candidatus Hadarchaeia archaeon]